MQESRKNVVVIIPVYKATPSAGEKASFRQCLDVLGRYDIVLLTFKELNISEYEQIEKSRGKNVKKEFFDSDYFRSLYDYNRLCLSKELYIRFSDYVYMLIYQLDAWVFRDELEKWCEKGYDYIGAPWFFETPVGQPYKFIRIVGNGGFSLRRIAFCLDVLRRDVHKPILTLQGLLLMSEKWLDWLKLPLHLLGIKNSVASFVNDKDKTHYLGEDLLFARFKYSYRKCYIPDPEDALKFAFENHPSFLFQQNNCCLPFGCHAYRKNEFETFWTHYIKE